MPRNDDTENESTRYQLCFNESTQQLIGIVHPRQSQAEDGKSQMPQPAPSPYSLNSELQCLGYDDFYFPPNSIIQFIKHIQRFEEGEYPLAERRDAKIKITLASNKSTARVQTEQAWGGKKLTQDTIMNEIRKAKIHKDTLDRQKIRVLLNSEESIDLIIANAIPPINGKDARLIPLVESQSLIAKDSDSDQAIDQRERFEFIIVEPGQALMKKIPATSGTHGLDVTGKEIKASPGKNIDFERPLKGVDTSDEDENLLVATLKGHPLIRRSGVQVDPVMVLDAVDIHSGNIEYDGSLVVKKDIEAGFSVSVSGDILVKGSIFKAWVKAGGDLEVLGGVTADDSAEDNRLHLDIKGNIQAKYLHHISVSCSGDIHVHEYIMQCQLFAQGTIYVGQTRGRGCIIGGHCTSHTGIQAKVIGSEAFVATEITLGSDNDLHKHLNQLKQRRKQHTYEVEQLSTILEKIRSSNNPTNVGQITLNKARKIENTINLLNEKNMLLDEKIEDLDSKIHISDDLNIKVTGYIYPNVHIDINGQPWSSGESLRRVQIKRDGKNMQITNLADS